MEVQVLPRWSDRLDRSETRPRSLFLNSPKFSFSPISRALPRGFSTHFSIPPVLLNIFHLQGVFGLRVGFIDLL